jgi:short-subunit dehydrogenase
MRDLKGKNALLTGASRGIGVHIARELARSGVNLALSARPASLPSLEALAGELQGFGVRAVVIPADLSQPGESKLLVDCALEQSGSLDILVNNAGVEYHAAFADLEEAIVREIVEVNLLSAMELTRLVLPGMLAQCSGHILTISSMSGKSPVAYNSVYSATKAALIAWSWALHDELRGTGVSNSVVCPGYIAEVGLHARYGIKPPRIAGEIPPQKVARTVIKALRDDRMEVLVMRMPIRPLLAMRELLPEAAGLFYRWTGLIAFLQRKVVIEEQWRSQKSPPSPPGAAG